MVNIASAGFGDIVGIGFRIITHRAEIMQVWSRLAPMIRDGAGMYPDIYELVNKIVPGLIEEQAPPRLPQAVGATDDDDSEDYSIIWLQESLNKLDNADLEIDGEYGEETKKAVKNFQHQHGLEPDGWAGAGTSAKIHEELEKLGA